MTSVSRWTSIAAVIGLTACGGGETAERGGEEPGAVPASAAEPAAALPVTEPQGAPDAELAARGEELFTTRGCVACHYVGREQRLVGPDLAGVPERRDFGWFYHMVTNPDSMVRNDPTAKELFAEYMTPMTDMNVQDEEVVALWEYLRRETADGGS